MKQEIIKDDMPPVSEYVNMNDGIKNGSPLDKYSDWLPDARRARSSVRRSDESENFMDYKLYETVNDEQTS